LSRGSAVGSPVSAACTVRRVLELLAAYPDQAAIIAEYPYLEPEDFQQALHYAAAAVDDERLSVA
jgi:uncharacterized protein (DUF433 family)